MMMLMQAVAYGGDHGSIPQSRHGLLSERLRKQRGGSFDAYEVRADCLGLFVCLGGRRGRRGGRGGQTALLRVYEWRH